MKSLSSKSNNYNNTSSFNKISYHISVLKATIIMNIQIILRYKANLIGMFIELILMIGSFFVFSRVVDFRTSNMFIRNPGDNALLIFFLVGIIVMFYQDLALYSPVNTVRRDLYNGTLEYLYSGPQSRYLYFLGNIITGVIFRSIFVIPTLALLMIVTGTSSNLINILIILIIFFFILTSVGILVSLMAIAWKQVTNIIGIIGIILQFVSGTFLPVQSFPNALQYLSYILPFTFAYDLIRYYAYSKNWVTIVPVHTEWILLSSYAIIYFIASIYLLKIVEKHTKKTGLHLI